MSVSTTDLHIGVRYIEKNKIVFFQVADLVESFRQDFKHHSVERTWNTLPTNVRQYLLQNMQFHEFPGGAVLSRSSSDGSNVDCSTVVVENDTNDSSKCMYKKDIPGQSEQKDLVHLSTHCICYKDALKLIMHLHPDFSVNARNMDSFMGFYDSHFKHLKDVQRYNRWYRSPYVSDFVSILAFVVGAVVMIMVNAYFKILC